MTTTAQGEQFESGPYTDTLNAFRLMFLTRDEKAVYHALELLKRILQNIQKHPEESVYHHIRLSAQAIQDRLIPVPGSLDVLRSAGFRDAGDSEHLELPTLNKADCEKIRRVIVLLDSKINDMRHPYETVQDPVRSLESDLGLLKKFRRKEERSQQEVEIEERIEAAKKERRAEQEMRRSRSQEKL